MPAPDPTPGVVSDWKSSDGTSQLLQRLVSNTYSLASAGGGGAAWGSITGTLSDQTDLQAALDAKATKVANTFTGQQTISLNGAASTPPLTLTGTWFTGGSGTTTKPQLLIEPTGATTNNWSTSGTGLGINAATGFAGNLIATQLNGAARFSVGFDAKTILRADNTTLTLMNNSGSSRVIMGDFSGTGSWFQLLTDNAIINLGVANDVTLTRKAAATLQMGADAAGVTNQMFTAANRITSDGVGANLTIAPGNGLGAAGGSLIFSTFTTGATGVAGTLTPRLYVNGPNGFLQFGGQTNQFPALTNSTTELRCRLADDSDFADLAVANLTASAQIDAAGGFLVNTTPGVTVGPFTSITSITVEGGIVTDLQGS